MGIETEGQDGKGPTEPVLGEEKAAEGADILGDDEAQSGDKGGEPKGQDATAADPYEAVKFPEGADVDKDFFGDVKAWAKENQVKPEVLTKLLDQWGKRAIDAKKQAETGRASALKEMNDGYVKELKADKEFGGAKYDENVSAVRKFLNKVDADKSFRKELAKTNAGNWPPLVRFLSKLAAANKDDSVAGTVDQGAPESAATSDEKFYGDLYPTMKK